jgi:hypothetical protein
MWPRCTNCTVAYGYVAMLYTEYMASAFSGQGASPECEARASFYRSFDLILRTCGLFKQWTCFLAWQGEHGIPVTTYMA